MRTPELELVSDPEHSYTLSAEHYYQSEIFQREKQRLFYGTWHVNHVSRISNVGETKHGWDL